MFLPEDKMNTSSITLMQHSRKSGLKQPGSYPTNREKKEEGKEEEDDEAAASKHELQKESATHGTVPVRV